MFLHSLLFVECARGVEDFLDRWYYPYPSQTFYLSILPTSREHTTESTSKHDKMILSYKIPLTHTPLSEVIYRRKSMKKITAVLLTMVLAISACGSPSGGSGDGGSSTNAAQMESDSAGDTEEASNSEIASDASEGGTSYENAAEDTAQEDGGFVSAEEAEEAPAETEASADSGATNAPSEEAPASSGHKPLVILEQQDSDYRAAAEHKKTKVTDATTSTLRANGLGDGEDGENTVLAALPKKDYTVMVYIVGSNLESRYGAATNDIAEMKQSGLDYEKANLLVYTGGSRRWVSNIPSTRNSVLDMSKDISEDPSEDGAERIVAGTEVSADMGTSQTLTEFINYCTAYYPAEHYGLVLWDHGGGPLWGYGSDELFQNDSLLLEELRSAMDGTQFGPGATAAAKLDWVGFDACLMGTLENAKLWKDYASYLVGSEELEPGRGWDYRFLGILNETDDAGEVVSGIVDSYGKYYEENRSQFFDPDVTLAALDLSKTDEVIGAADVLFEAMQKGIGGGLYAQINQARSRAKAFGLSAAQSKEDAYDMIDLRDFAVKAGELFPEESGKLTEAVDSMVVRTSSNVEGAGGVSVYLPGDNRELYGVAQELYAQSEMLSGDYGEFVDAYTDSWFAGSDTDWTLAGLGRADGEMTLQLTEDQVKNASEMYYSVLFRNGWGGYQIATCNVRIRPDENNVLHVPEDPLLVTAGTDLQESVRPWACVQVSDMDGECIYRTVRAILTNGHEFTDFDLSTDEEVSVSVRNRKGETEAVIQDFTSASGSAWLSGKGSIDVSGYRSIMDIGGDTLAPIRDEDGKMRPYTEWEYKGYMFHPLAVDDSFRFYMRPASDFPIEYICQVTVKDVNGKLHASEYAELRPKSGTEQMKVKTEKGSLSFTVEEDHAELCSYSGRDTSLTVPDSVEGKPVTVIARAAFSGSETLESIVLPDSIEEIGMNVFYNAKALRQVRLPSGLKSIGMGAFQKSGIEEIELPKGLIKIGRSAFMECGLQSVRIPDTVQSIGQIPFACCASLTQIEIDGSNPNYKTVDGVLYTADGKTLIQYPGARGQEYEVEAGTEQISYGAFARADIRKVTLPESLRKIDNYAFFECYQLEPPLLPDSLESIGGFAFGRDRKSKAVPEERVRFETVRIGPGVRHIGNDAFTAPAIGGFEVSGENPVYASSGGFITNKAGDMIQTVPSGVDGRVVIPDGVTTLQNGLFTILDEETEFYIPDSVFRFSEKVFPCGRETSSQTGLLEDVYLCTIHCTEGSAAWQYASKYGIKHDSVTDPALMDFEEVSEEGDNGTFYWRVFSDRAELYAFQGNKKDLNSVLEIPSRFRDLPVTALRYDETADKEQTNNSFNIVKIIIPDSVTAIEGGFLKSHYFVSEIEVAGDNPQYVSKDGVLFTRDMETLVRYPIKREETEYSVPSGVKTIEESAFMLNTALEKVTTPSSLRAIRKNAFASCRNLREAVLGKGLREIDDGAFSLDLLENVKLPSTVEWIGSGTFTLHEGFGGITLPDKLRKMGYAAFRTKYGETCTQEVIRIPAKLELELRFFDGVLFERYEADPKSEYYTVRDGFLMSRDEKTLVSVPTLTEGEFRVPDGTLYINYYAFDTCDRITDIYLPDSVLDVGNIGVKGADTGRQKYTIHCRAGSEPARLLDAQHVSWVAIE